MTTENEITRIILNDILTPVIYMLEYENEIEFVCFCDSQILMKQIYKTEQALSELLNKTSVILDIRELPEPDRVELLHQADLIYCESDAIKQIFEISMLEDYKMYMDKRAELVERIKKTGTGYMA